MSADYESVSCVKNEVFVYKIPPRPSNRGYKAADWSLDKPDWKGRLRVVAKGKALAIKLEDKVSGELFAKCPVETYPGPAVEAVTDSSRYFVIRILNDNGQSASIGIGFQDRGDSFDLNVALQEHFKWLKTTDDIEKQSKQSDSAPKLDLGFKEGQTIKINIAGRSTKPREKKQNTGGGLGLLPPPPGSSGGAGFLPPPPGGARLSSGQSSQPAAVQVQQVSQSQPPASNTDLLMGISAPPPAQQNTQQVTGDPFASLGSSSGSVGGGGWEQF
ncbi:unnamed protein product [Owenia fusiformis]|uniref:NECAP PHear domain-containing protein n=1 Tax=Owenia fusiformis TaxID=6347 RepID=A0A8S4N3D2_OWEFU|nr:unnamed protein product [Owenia fusiformis]